MANKEFFEILGQGVDVWNEWRLAHPKIESDLSGADFSDAELSKVNFSSSNLSNANFRNANFGGANFDGTNLSKATLIDADFYDASFSDAKLGRANIARSNLGHATLFNADLNNANLASVNLTKANLSNAQLAYANFLGATLTGAIFNQASASRTIFADLDLRGVKGLETIKHYGPSEISISTIYQSEGEIPEEFLRGCGVPDEFITQISALVGALQPIQFYSCFISYSSKDEEFARRLHSRMREAGLRVWFAPEDIKGGEKLYEQIDRAIQVYDRLLLVLSKSSMVSEWVMTEIRRARKAEVKENRRKLFPIRLTDYESLKEWECFDADQGKDLAVEVREYYIPDFSTWKSYDDFEKACARLLTDLKANA